MNEKVVIIGAGGSGRGFLARLLQEEGAKICFVDQNTRLIRKLAEQKSYKIRLGRHPDAITIEGYEAFLIGSEEAVEKSAAADWLFISVGEEHLKETAPFLEQVRKARNNPLKVLVCENGISPKNTLRKALENGVAKDTRISQGIIFCTSIQQVEAGLDIISEDYSELPYDMDEELFVLPFVHFIPTKNFGTLLQRKIYTYNCLSACIAYLGAYLGYEIYAEAAMDAYIRNCCEKLSGGLNRVLCRKLQVDNEEQRIFSQRAMQKFSNPDIVDTIKKNARSVVRKLSPKERIMGPMIWMKEAGEDISVLELVAAAALLYLERNEEMVYQGKKYINAFSLFQDLNPQMGKGEIKRIKADVLALRNGKHLSALL